MKLFGIITGAKVDVSILAFYIPFVSVGSTLARIANRNKRIILKFMEEIWKHIDGYDFLYKVSNLGNIKQIMIKDGRVFEKDLPKHTQSSGYLQVRLRLRKISKYKLVHRLVAQTFIQNSENKKEINHKNSIQNDNRVENLEWCTRNENAKHASVYGNMGKTIIQYTKQGEYINTWKSLTKASDELGILKPAICQALKGKSKTSGGFIWKYANNL